mgnify:CR=1 FL=1
MNHINLYDKDATLQNILKHYYPIYEKSNKIEEHVRKAAFKMINCRTEFFGGHKYICPDCGETKIVYNPCHHRSCPECSSIAKQEWLNKQMGRLPNSGYFHAVFTIPSELNKYFMINRSIFTDILFDAVKESITGMAANPEFLGAEPGLLSVLHTWGSALPLHPHIHTLITDGGLDENGKWMKVKRSKNNDKGFFVPVKGEKGLMGVFKGKLMYKLIGLLFKNKLNLPDNIFKIDAEKEFQLLKGISWNVYIEEKTNSSKRVIMYLANYVKGGSIGNSRIKKVENGVVHFYYRNSKNSRRKEMFKLDVFEFIRRVFLHIPDKGKKIVRNHGIFSNNNKIKLNKAREYFGQLAVEEVEIKEIKREVKCNKCGKSMLNYCEVESSRQRIEREFIEKVSKLKYIA